MLPALVRMQICRRSHALANLSSLNPSSYVVDAYSSVKSELTLQLTPNPCNDELGPNYRLFGDDAKSERTLGSRGLFLPSRARDKGRILT